MNAALAIVDKRRDKHNEAVAEYVIGDVKDKICIMFDDIIDTAGTITEAAKLLKKKGAKEIYVCAVHPVFSGPALQRLEDAPIEEVVVTNSIPLVDNAPKKITQLSVAPILGEAISRIHDNESVSSIFGFEKEYKG
jgi:ribose-phosphate pyrophosphokinase